MNGRGLYILLVVCPPAPGRDPKHRSSYVKSMHRWLRSSSTRSALFAEDRRRWPKSGYLAAICSNRLPMIAFLRIQSQPWNVRSVVLPRESSRNRSCRRVNHPPGPAGVESMADRVSRRSFEQRFARRKTLSERLAAVRGNDPQVLRSDGETERPAWIEPTGPTQPRETHVKTQSSPESRSRRPEATRLPVKQRKKRRSGT